MAMLTSPPSKPKAHIFISLHRLSHQPRGNVAPFRPLPKASTFPKPEIFLGNTNLLRHFHVRSNDRRIGLVTNAALSESAEPVNGKRIMFSDVVVKRPRRVFSGRKWNSMDMGTAGVVLAMHLLSLFAPFHCNWAAFWVALSLYIVTGLFGITLSFHRNLSHRSFKLPKWLEYLCAYCGALALQCGGPNNVSDLEKQTFYKFLKNTYIVHPIAMATLLYALGGFPFLVWGMGVRVIWVYHITWLVNSACHVWGKQAWKTDDLSRNNWWVALLAFGEGWHNNHHAFEYSARHGLEWWQIDMTWYVVKLLQVIGLATEVKLPNETHKQRMALNN